MSESSEGLKAGFVMAARNEFPHGHPRFTEITIDELELHSRKNKDYASGGNPLGNFMRVANILSNYPNLRLDNPAVVALVYMLKQLDASLWMLSQGYEGEVEGLDDRLQDVHVYAKLARLILHDLRTDASGLRNEQRQS